MALPLQLADYPSTLTNKHWQAKKGNIAKMVGKTGVGEQLTKCEAAHKKISWTLFDARMNGKLHSIQEVDDLLSKAKAEWGKVDGFRKELFKARDVLEESAKKFKANKLVPSSATKLALEMAKEAETLAVLCKSMDTKDFDEYKDSIQKIIDLSLKKVGKDVNILIDALKEGLKTPTYDFWDSTIKQKFRSVGNSLAVVPELKDKYWGTWKNYDGFQHSKVTAKGDPDEEKKMTDLIKKMGKEAMDLKKSMGV